MSAFNVLYNWAQTTNASFTSHVESTTAHGVSGNIVGASDTQILTNKTLSDNCSWQGNAIPISNGGTNATTAQQALINLGAASASHTHNYAGSSTAGGSATSALTCSGNSATATKLQNARTIGGVSFDGSANINLPGVNTKGNQDTTGNADTATTAISAGTAGVANKLGNSTVGSATKPIYLNAGQATECSGPLNIDINGTSYKIRTSAPSSPSNGDIWIE